MFQIFSEKIPSQCKTICKEKGPIPLLFRPLAFQGRVRNEGKWRKILFLSFLTRVCTCEGKGTGKGIGKAEGKGFGPVPCLAGPALPVPFRFRSGPCPSWSGLVLVLVRSGPFGFVRVRLPGRVPFGLVRADPFRFRSSFGFGSGPVPVPSWSGLIRAGPVGIGSFPFLPWSCLIRSGLVSFPYIQGCISASGSVSGPVPDRQGPIPTGAG